MAGIAQERTMLGVIAACAFALAPMAPDQRPSQGMLVRLCSGAGGNYVRLPVDNDQGKGGGCHAACALGNGSRLIKRSRLFPL